MMKKQKKTSILNQKELNQYEHSNYEYWANIARALHVKYKVFSLGWIQKSIFSSFDQKQRESIEKVNQAKCALYLRLAAISAVDQRDLLAQNEKAPYKDLQKKKHYLAWLEHRRWNAFTRTIGYRWVDVHKNLKAVGSHKDMRLKLHSCLVETQFPNNPDRENCYLWMSGDLSEYSEEKLDLLDCVSKAKNFEYKQYDYSSSEINGISSKKDLKKILEELQLN